MIQTGAWGDRKADGYVILNGTFTTPNQTTDGKRKWSLRAVVAEHAPDRLDMLKFGVHPLGGPMHPDALVLKVPSTLEIEIPTQAFPIKGNGNVTFTAECRLDRATDGIALIRVLDRRPRRRGNPGPPAARSEAPRSPRLRGVRRGILPAVPQPLLLRR